MAITKVTTDVITDLAVTAPKLAADSVITDKIADNAVTAAKIAAGALGDQVAGITSSASATTIAGTLTSTGDATFNGTNLYFNGAASSADYNLALENSDTFTSFYGSTSSSIDKGYKFFVGNQGADLAFIINADKKVGIGASPASGLHLTGADNTAAKVTLTNSANSNTYSIHPQNNAQTLKFQEDGTTVMILGTGGKLGVGDTADPTRRLTVKSAGANATQISLVDNDSTNEVFAVGQQSDGDGFLTVKQDDGTTKVLFDASGDSYINGGNVGVGIASPSGILHVDGHTSSVSSIFEGNGNGDTVPVQLKVKANNGTTSTQGLYGNAGSASTDNTITLGGSGTSGVIVDNGGKVGINTTPDTLLNLKDTGGIEVRLEADSNNNGQEDCFIRFYTDGKTQEGIAGMDNNNSSTLFSGNTENGMVFGTVSNLPTLFATNNTQRMIIGADGDVHIGDSGSYTGMFTVNDTTASSNKIIAHFQGQGNGSDTTTGGQYISVNRTGPISSASNSVQGGLILGSNSATGPGCAIQSIYQYNNGRDMRFLTTHDNSSDPSIRMVLTGAGQLCVGYTDAKDGAHLSVVSNGGEGIFNGVESTNAYRRYYHTVSDGIHRFKGSANTATITNAGAWQNASDFAYKEDIQDISYGLDTVKALRPRTFKMKGTDLGDGKGLDQQIGFIAQEVESVVPEVVDGEDGEKTLGYGVLTSVLVKAIQELEARVKELEG